jgi:hypothetical protein
VSLSPFDPETGYLPSGEHVALWVENRRPLRWTSWRRGLLDGLSEAASLLAMAGCRRIWLNGSFVTAKDTPGDFDAVWDDSGVDESGLDPVFFDLGRGRKAQKMRFGGELFPNWLNLSSDSLFSEFFQHDRTGRRKDIVVFNPADVNT